MFNKEKLMKIKDIIDFANTTNRLNYLVRYPTTPHVTNETVSSHSYQVCILSLFLYERFKEEYDLNFKGIISQALVHDVSESDEKIGDISHPQKEKNQELKKALTELEYEVIYNLLGENYVNYMKEYNECKTTESILVNIADVISCLIYSEFEIMKGNRFMERVKYESEERLVDLLDLLEEKQKE